MTGMQGDHPQQGWLPPAGQHQREGNYPQQGQYFPRGQYPPTSGGGSGRSAKPWLIGGGVVAVLAVIGVVLAMVLDLGSSSKPAITRLSDGMLLTADEFPMSGDFRSSQLYNQTYDDPENGFFHSDEDCSWVGSISSGSIQGGGERSGAKVELLAFDPVLSSECRDSLTSRFPAVERKTLAGLPAGVLVTETSDSEYLRFDAVGFVRDVFIAVTTGADVGGSRIDEVKADLVTIYNRQAEKLNAS